MNIAFKPKTPYQQLLEAPPGVIAEVIDGELYMQAQPANPHQVAALRLGAFLELPFGLGRGGPGGWWILPETQFSTADPNWRTMVPDISGWRRDRVPVLPGTYFEVAPDWVCEVLSPSTRAIDRDKKSEVYAQEGVKHLWLLDPYQRLLEAYRNDQGEWREILSLKESGQICAAPFEAIAIELADLWSNA